MKKLLAILLAAALVLSLSVCALAEENKDFEDLTPPLWQRWGYDSLEDYLAQTGETEEEYAAIVAEALASRAEQDAYIATYDPETHDFTPALWEYNEYASKEEMMEAWEIDEAGYAGAVDDELFNYESRDWTDEQWNAWFRQQDAAMIQAEREARGLTKSLNIMADGAALEFAGAEPVIRNSCTMAPLSAIAPALRAEFSFDPESGAIRLSRGGASMELAIDSEILSFETEGPDGSANGGIFYLDSLPYAEDGEAFVPLRAVAEALGYEVEWSSAFRTAVLLDLETAAAQFDQRFTVMNAVLAMSQALDRRESYQGESRLDLEVSLPALGSMMAYSGSVSASALSRGNAAHAAVQFDLDELLGLLGMMAGSAGEADSAELEALTAALGDGIELICDLDSGSLYLRGALFAAASGREDLPADAWYALDLKELEMPDMAELNELAAEKISFGRLICMIAQETGTDPIYLYETLEKGAASFSALDDSHFTTDSNVFHMDYALPLDGEAVLGLDVSIDDGKATELSGSILYDVGGTKLDCAFTVSGLSASMNGSCLVEGAVRVDFTLTAEGASAPGAEVPTAPPADATVVDLAALLNGLEIEAPADIPEPDAA